MDNPPQLKGEAPVEVAVLAVREEGDSDLDDDDEITPNPVGHKGLMRSARSSIEYPASYLASVEACSSRTPPPSLTGASRSYRTSLARTSVPINLVHIVDLNFQNSPSPATGRPPSVASTTEEVDDHGRPVHVYLSSKHERTKAVLGIVGKDELAEDEKRERVRIVCRSEHWTATAGVVQRFPEDQPFTIDVSSVHQQAFLVLPRTFRGPIHLSTTYCTTHLSPGIKASFVEINPSVGFLGDKTTWSWDLEKVEEEGLDEAFVISSSARVHVRYEDEEEELSGLEKTVSKVEKKIAGWFKNALDSL